MSKKSTSGLSYFNFDTEFFSDIKVRKLIKYQSGKAITVYAYLLCNIYKEGYYMKWDNELPFVISEATGYDEAYIQDVIKCCLNVGLLSKVLFEKYNVLTSSGIQKRFEEICIKAKRKFRVTEFNVISSEETCINSEVMAINTEDKPINTEVMPQSKVKKSKVKKSKVENSHPLLEDVRKYFDENGYTMASSDKFFQYYDCANWHDSNGNKVRNWKQKAQSVWFKDENKKPIVRKPMLQNNEW